MFIIRQTAQSFRGSNYSQYHHTTRCVLYTVATAYDLRFQFVNYVIGTAITVFFLTHEYRK